MNIVLGTFLSDLTRGGTAIVVILLAAMTLVLIPVILFLITLQNTFTEISVENRKMKPGQVWLTLIPIFGIGWQFIVVARLSDSLEEEFASRGIHCDEERPGNSIGLAYCILSCCTIVPVLGFFAGIASLVCWIIYWVKINDYKNRLMQTN